MGVALGGSLGPGGLAEMLGSMRLSAARSLSPIAQGRPFEMIVLGDSIMWGQGLKEEQKFSYAVGQWLRARLPGVEVHRHVFAHSGARIKENEVEDAKPPTHGEVPNHFPSITAQVVKAQSATFPLHPPLDPRSVSLILLDGGINDFGSKVILNPDPTVGRAWVRKITRERCVDRMKGLLPKVADAFPNAKIVLTNYFQIVSEQSDMVYLWELLRLWDVVGDVINFMSAPVRAKMSDHSLAFHQESTAGFREAVSEVSRSLVASGKPSPQAAIAASVGRLQVPPSRVALAEVPFGPQHAYAAPQTLLFHINEPDPAASVRKPMCMEQVPNSSPELPNCLLAAAGHPNVNGASVYARTVIGVLDRWLPEWQSSFGTSAPKTTDRGTISTPTSTGRP